MRYEVKPSNTHNPQTEIVQIRTITIGYAHVSITILVKASRVAFALCFCGLLFAVTSYLASRSAELQVDTTKHIQHKPTCSGAVRGWVDSTGSS